MATLEKRGKNSWRLTVYLGRDPMTGDWIRITKHLIPAFGKLKLQKIPSMHIETSKLEKLKNGRRDGKGGLSKRSVRYHLVIFNQA